MSTIDAGDALRPLAEILSPVPRLWERLKSLAGGPAPGSRAARDTVTALGQRSWLLAHLGASVAIDHLETWRRLCTGKEPVHPTFGHLTLIRSSIESSVTTRYLTDPTSDQKERFRRGAGAYRADLEERRKYEKRRPDMIAPKGKTAVERMAELDKWLGKAALKAKEPPSITRLCAEYLGTTEKRDGEYIYRLLSAFAHGKQWPVLAGSTWELFGPAAGVTGAQLTKITAHPRVAAELSAVAVDALQAAMADLERYAGSPAK